MAKLASSKVMIHWLIDSYYKYSFRLYVFLTVSYGLSGSYFTEAVSQSVSKSAYFITPFCEHDIQFLVSVMTITMT